jgi:trehalose 6-phosphate synthase
MNLVAKEFVAAQDPRDPGVLVLSRFAGAAEELKAALIVNPHDPDSIALALGHALALSPIQRQMRNKWLRAQMARSDIALWRANYLQTLVSAGNLTVEAADPVMVGAA